MQAKKKSKLILKFGEKSVIKINSSRAGDTIWE